MNAWIIGFDHFVCPFDGNFSFFFSFLAWFRWDRSEKCLYACTMMEHENWGFLDWEFSFGEVDGK